MTGTTYSRTRTSLLSGAAAIALGLFTQPVMAQRPVLNAATTGAALRPVAAQREPDPVAPEAPQSGQNTPPVKDDLFAGTEKFAKGASDVTEVTMDPNSLDLVGGPDSGRAHRMVLNVVRTYSYDKPGMYNPADVEEYRHKLETGDWHCSVHIRDLKNGESTDVCSKRRAPDMVENAIITVSPKSLTFVHNIRKVNGQGGELNLGIMPGLGVLPGLGPMLSMQMMAPGWQAQIQAQMRAQMLASTAALRAQMPELMASVRGFHFELTPEQQKQIDGLGKSFRFEFHDRDFDTLKNFHFELSPEQKQEIDKLQNGLTEHN